MVRALEIIFTTNQSCVALCWSSATLPKAPAPMTRPSLKSFALRQYGARLLTLSLPCGGLGTADA